MRVTRRSIKKISQKIGYIFLLTIVALAGIFWVFVAHKNTQAASCPCNLFSASATGFGNYSNGSAIGLGVRFTPSYNGVVNGVRFYKSSAMGGTHVGMLWNTTNRAVMATATFTNETSSGWQDVQFSTPVAVTANQQYVASFNAQDGNYIATSNYFTNPITTDVMSAPATTNGVYASNPANMPAASFNATNYWVDVDYSPGTGSAPTVLGATPMNNATDALPYMNVTASFDQPLDSRTVSSSTATLLDSQGQSVPVTIGYNATTYVVSLLPTSSLTIGKTYTAWLKGGASGISNAGGQAMTTDYHWTFTVADAHCPCSLWGNDAQLDSNSDISSNAEQLTVGQVMVAKENGYLQAIRYYTPPLQTAPVTHQVEVWGTDGTLLAQGTSSNESQGGWQEVALSSPLAVTSGQQFVISYFLNNEKYLYTQNGLAAGVDSGALQAVANGGRFNYGTAPAYPNTASTTNYWVDTVFTEGSSYTEPFQVSSWQPTDRSFGVKTSDALTATLSQAANPATVTGNVTLKTSAGQTVPGSVTYDALTYQVKFTPSSPLANDTGYTLSLSNALQSNAGQPLQAGSTSFTTGAPATTSLTNGKGGSILVVTDTNTYDTYLTEILRTEGMNNFTIASASQLSASMLGAYKVILLGETTLSNLLVSSLTSWVNNGGNLIAFKPNSNLNGLLGITNQAGTLSNGYIKINTTTAPGAGLVSSTIQYHTAANLIGLQGGTSTVAELYQDASTDAQAPAVTLRHVGNGYASAFSYNLGQSIALTHQGNPAQVGTSADGTGTFRPDSLFHTGSAPLSTDWLNVSKAAIPQADEQQRLLANIITYTTTQSTGALPHYWYFPNGNKGAVIMQVDDHNRPNPSMYYFQHLAIQNTDHCSIIDWACARGGAYIFPAVGMTSSQALLAQSLGFTVGVHYTVSFSPPQSFYLNCANYTSQSQLSQLYDQESAGVAASFPGLDPQHTTRTHCFEWADWDSTPKVDVAHDIHFNLNYEWYPNTWTGSSNGYLTGSGMTMRFTDASGNLIDDFQGVTDLDFETDDTTAMMNAAMTGVTSNNYYGMLGTHTDDPTDGNGMYMRNLIATARSYGLPLISAQQALTWKQAQSASTFTNVTSTPYKLTFSPEVAEGGEGMMAMIPVATSNGALTALTDNGQPVSYSIETITGIDYAVFYATPGSYQALYGSAPVTPVTPMQPLTSNTGNTTIMTKDPFATTAQAGNQGDTSSEVTSASEPPFGNEGTTAPLQQSPSVAIKSSNTKKGDIATGVVVGIATGVLAIGAGAWWAAASLRRRKK